MGLDNLPATRGCVPNYPIQVLYFCDACKKGSQFLSELYVLPKTGEPVCGNLMCQSPVRRQKGEDLLPRINV